MVFKGKMISAISSLLIEEQRKHDTKRHRLDPFGILYHQKFGGGVKAIMGAVRICDGGGMSL